ncbi:MAG: M15 family metallopeptidase [Ferruginibacter sp.]|nr:M15 family metallopeptidase [Cytophagales bacterium]
MSNCPILFRALLGGALVASLLACRPERKPAETTTAPAVAAKPAATAPATPRKADFAEQSLKNAGLVDVQTLDPAILVDLKYSTTDNFVGVDVYGDLTRAYLQTVPAQKLVKAQQLLVESRPGYHLLIYDAARPRRVQQILWDTLKKPPRLKPLYVADPKEGSIHNYGAAVDLTIADERGQPLDMGTSFDFFGELAYPTKEDSLVKLGKLTLRQITNRRTLREVMRRAGFAPIDSEWWHFNAMSLERCKQEYGIIE